jgi:addiction module RelB/DinJ family antitoxin
MNTKTLLTVKTDKTLKKAAQDVAEELGFSLGTLVNSFLKQFVRDKEVSFSVSYRPSKYLISVIEEAEKEFAAGKSAGPFTGDEFIKHLKKL